MDSSSTFKEGRGKKNKLKTMNSPRISTLINDETPSLD